MCNQSKVRSRAFKVSYGTSFPCKGRGGRSKPYGVTIIGGGPVTFPIIHVQLEPETNGGSSSLRVVRMMRRPEFNLDLRERGDRRFKSEQPPVDLLGQQIDSASGDAVSCPAFRGKHRESSPIVLNDNSRDDFAVD